MYRSEQLSKLYGFKYKKKLYCNNRTSKTDNATNTNPIIIT